MEAFIKFLSQRNRKFIDQISSESALGIRDNDYFTPASKKKCIVVSFDPPMKYPPFIFNWSSSDILYFNNPTLDKDFYSLIEEALAKVEQTYIVFVERRNPPHLRKINRWIKNFREIAFRNKPMTEIPGFILAEYRAALFEVKLSEMRLEAK